MRRTSIPPDNTYMILCPRLGHLISFSYCRFENRGIPCFRIIGCWYDYFLIEDYLRKELANHEWDKAFRHTDQPKITALVESIEKARKTMNSGDIHDKYSGMCNSQTILALLRPR